MSRSSVAAVVAAIVVAAVSAWPRSRAPAPAPSGLARAFAGVSSGDRAVICGVYESLAKAVEKDDALVTTTRVLADGIGRGLDLAFDGRKPSADGSLGEAIDAHLATVMGFLDDKGNPAAIPDIVITPAMRSKIVAGLRDVSNAAR